MASGKGRPAAMGRQLLLRLHSLQTARRAALGSSRRSAAPGDRTGTRRP